MVVDNKKIDQVFYQLIRQLTPEELNALKERIEKQEPPEREKLAKALENSGLLIHFPPEFNEYINSEEDDDEALIHIKGPPLSQTIIEDRI